MDEVASVIAGLDGDAVSLAVFESPEGPGTYLAVGGGDGRYLVMFCERNDRFALAVAAGGDGDGDEAANPADTVRLVVGGQPGDYERRFIVDASLALAAARSYRLTNQLDESIRWEWSR